MNNAVDLVRRKKSPAELLGEDAPTKIPDTVNADALALLLGESLSAIYKLAKMEILVRASHGEYSLRDSVRNYCRHIAHDPDADALMVEKIRQTREAADQLAIKNKKAKGELLDAAEVERTWAGVLRDLRAAMLAVPSRVGSRLPALSQHDISEVSREIKDALVELAHGSD